MKIIVLPFVVCALFFSCAKNQFEKNLSKNASNQKDLFNTNNGQQLAAASAFSTKPQGCYNNYLSASMDTIRSFFKKGNGNGLDPSSQELLADFLSQKLLNVSNSFDDCLLKSPLPRVQVEKHAAMPKDPNANLPIYVLYDDEWMDATLSELSNSNYLNDLALSINNTYNSNPTLYSLTAITTFNLLLDGILSKNNGKEYLLTGTYVSSYFVYTFLLNISSGAKVPYKIARKYLARPENPIQITEYPIPVGGSFPNEYDEVWGGIIVHVNSLDSTVTNTPDENAFTLTYSYINYNTYIKYTQQNIFKLGVPQPQIWSKNDIIGAIDLYYNSQIEKQNQDAVNLSTMPGFIDQLKYYINIYYFICGGALGDGTPGPLKIDPLKIPVPGDLQQQAEVK